MNWIFFSISAPTTMIFQAFRVKNYSYRNNDTIIDELCFFLSPSPLLLILYVLSSDFFCFESNYEIKFECLHGRQVKFTDI